MTNHSRPTSAVALLTSPRKGGIGVLYVHGEEGEKRVSQIFRGRGKKPRKLAYGEIVDGDQVVDEVLLYRPSHGRGIEIHCHGGLAIVEGIIDLLDLPQVSPESLLEEEATPWESEADRHLRQCRSKRAMDMLLHQRNGALARAIGDIDNLLDEKKVEAAREKLDELISTGHYGRALVTPVKVLILGAPNAGKSSLLNLLVDEKKSIVSPIPGTTRDGVEDMAVIDGFPLDFMDSAGLRSTSDLVEKYGIEKAHQHVAASDLLVILFDSSIPGDDESLTLWKNHSDKALGVVNKTDLDRHPWWEEGEFPQVPLNLSCLTGSGVEELKRAVVDKLIPEQFDHGRGIVFTNDQKELLEQCRSQWDSSLSEVRAQLGRWKASV